MLRLSARLAARSTRHSLYPSTSQYNMPPKRTTSSNANAVPAGYSIDPSAPPILRFQASLPHLPVPSLASTGSKYLESVRPHLTDAEFKTTEDIVHAFVASPQSAELQRRLQDRAAQPGMQNWLADWWNETAYMGYRDPVVVYVSYFFVHLDDKRRRDSAKRASALIKATMAFRDMNESGRLEPERARDTPLCMESYRWLFHASRYPVKPSDMARKFDAKTHNHVVFVRKNKFYKVPLVTPAGVEVSAAELEVQIERIIQHAGNEKSTPVGVLTSDNRDRWAEARQDLLAASPINAESLEAIESAMIIVPLDDTKPVTRDAISLATWAGDGRNRFYDKHQLIVHDNGRSGFLGEHCCMDGTPTLRLNEFILASIASNKINLGPSRTEETGKHLPEPVELKFVLDDKSRKNIQDAEKRFDELVGQHDLHVLHYEGYGKNVIKKFKVSPDAWAQLVKQLAFHKMFGRLGVTYESAQTRKYKLGRTEVIRSASSECKLWCESMLDVNATDECRAELFRKAATRHLQYAAWAADGQGVDRHLFGLKKMLREGEPLPDLYKDAAFSKTNHWELSTSQLSSKFIDGWGYGEVVPDGYGLAYSINEDSIRWTITSLKRNTEDLKHYLAEAATETRIMMEKASAPSAKL